jgi:hypothetical protein
VSETPDARSGAKSEAQLRMEAAPVLRMVCVGKDMGAGKTPCWLLQALSESNALAEKPPILLPTKDLKQIGVGEIIELKMEGSTYWPNTARHVGTWKDEAQRLEWQAAARAWDSARRVEKETENEKRRILLKEHLEPLRGLYKKLPMLQAVSLLAEVIYYMETGSTKMMD